MPAMSSSGAIGFLRYPGCRRLPSTFAIAEIQSRVLLGIRLGLARSSVHGQILSSSKNRIDEILIGLRRIIRSPSPSAGCFSMSSSVTSHSLPASSPCLASYFALIYPGAIASTLMHQRAQLRAMECVRPRRPALADAQPSWSDRIDERGRRRRGSCTASGWMAMRNRGAVSSMRLSCTVCRLARGRTGRLGWSRCTLSVDLGLWVGHGFTVVPVGFRDPGIVWLERVQCSDCQWR